MRPDDAVSRTIDRALCCGTTCGRGTDAAGPCVAGTYGATIRQRLEAAGYVVAPAPGAIADAPHDRPILGWFPPHRALLPRGVWHPISWHYGGWHHPFFHEPTHWSDMPPPVPPSQGDEHV
jgi:hypothetical protein